MPEASRRLPVAFEATVTYFRGYENLMFVQDGDVQSLFASFEIPLWSRRSRSGAGNDGGEFPPHRDCRQV